MSVARVFFILTLCAGCGALIGSSHAEGTYSRKIQFNPVTMTYAELSDLINKTHAVLNVANANSMGDSVTERLTIGDDVQTVEFKGPFSSFSGARLPPVAYKLTFNYRNPSAPISEVQFWCWDSHRELEVQGTAPDQVDALAALMEKEIGAKTTYFGGTYFRMYVGFVLTGIGLLLTFLSSTVIVLGKVALDVRRIVSPAGKVILLLIGVILLLTPLVSNFLPVDQWFPGFSVYANSASFFDRHPVLFWFIGFLGVSTVVGLLKRIFRRPVHTSPSAQSASSHQAVTSERAAEIHDAKATNPESNQ